jgi:asparagine synthase (glutamine-hydrolysing)
MCGIFGLAGRASTQDTDRALCSLQHRGPDGSGVWRDDRLGVVLGHTRLAVIDRSDHGAQPMASRSGRFVIAFNGEIYNHRSVRRDLEANGTMYWRGHSDTETLVEAIEHFGINEALSRLVGMFAFAVWDRFDRALWLARDRIGEKPLYFGHNEGGFVFASEPKAILRLEDRSSRSACPSAVRAYLRYGYVPAPLSIWRGIRKLEPGSFLCFRPELQLEPQVQKFWSLEDAIAAGQAAPFEGDIEDAAQRLDELISSSVADQRVADVPVGVLLSGGIDSTLIASTMARAGGPPTVSLTVGWEDHDFDEGTHARAIAEFLGTQHVSERVSASDALQIIPTLSDIFDEPFADPSQIPTIIVSRLARRHVTVCLTGDGADELFGGYNRHVWINALAAWPRTARALAAASIRRFTEQQWRPAFEAVLQSTPRGLRPRSARDKAEKLCRLLAADDPPAAYVSLVSMGVPLASPSLELVSDGSDALGRTFLEIGQTPLEASLAIDSLTYLPDDVLCKVDRSAMSVSLETRAPYLDHRIVEFAWTLPAAFRVRGLQSKRVLRKVLTKHVPSKLWDRPKTGFGVPIDAWLRGPLRNWAEDLLTVQSLRRQDWLDESIVRQCLREHMTGAADWGRELWTALMFEQWRARWSS